VSYSPPPASFADEPWPAVQRLSLLGRLAALGAGTGLLALLLTAAWLTPSPLGRGTHQQLGLPPCTIIALYGMPCPSCGMTTAWAHLVQGRPIASLRCNAGGSLLALAALICGPWLVASGLRGWWLIGRPHEGLTLAVGLAIVLVTLTQWTLRLSLGW
jgi:uncharacterized protein DUF2752